MGTKRIPDRAGFVGAVTKCRWCEKPKPWDNNRRTFCSDECVEQHKIRTQPDHAAKRVLERDHGICVTCGVDTVALRADVTERFRAAVALAIPRPIECSERWMPVRQACEHEQCLEYAVSGAILHKRRQYHEALRDTEFVAWCCDRPVPIPQHLRTGERRLWEMDHIRPVVEGGADCGLDNLRTLCWACHRAETSALAARRAEERKATGAEPKKRMAKRSWFD